MNSLSFLKNKNLSNISMPKKRPQKNVSRKNIPFRSFENY